MIVEQSRPAPQLSPAVLALLPFGLLLFFVGCYTVALSVLSIRERAGLYQFDEDLAIYDQIVWNTSRGHLFDSTLIQHANNLLGDHFSPAVALFVPIYWVWPDARVLLIGQSLFLGLAAIPLFLLARRGLGGVGALFVGCAYLAYPALHFANLYQFHEITLLPLPLSVALLAVERGWRWRFVAAAVVALTVKEEVAIVIFGVGLLWWLRRRDLRMLLATLLSSVAAGYLTMGVILPHFSLAGAEYYYVRRYAYLGSTPLAMVATLLTSPNLVVAHLVTPDRLTFLAQLFLPLALGPLLGWEALVAALPVFGYLLLAESPDQYAINRHYLAPLLPFLFVGLAIGLGRLAALLSRGSWRDWKILMSTVSAAQEPGEAPRTTVVLSALLLLVVVGSSLEFGPTPLGRGYDSNAFAPSLHTQQAQHLLALVPPGASVSTTRNLLSWLSERTAVYRFPEINRAEYVLFDPRDLRYPAVYAGEGETLTGLLASANYRLIASDGAIFLFQLGDPAGWDVAPGQVTRFGTDVELGRLQATLHADTASVDVRFYWRALKRLSTQYTIFVHVYDQTGKLIGQTDTWPIDNVYPTDLWQPGRVIPDAHTVTLKSSPPFGALRVEAGLYDLKTGVRLPITARGLAGGTDFVESAVTSP